MSKLEKYINDTESVLRRKQDRAYQVLGDMNMTEKDKINPIS